MKSFAQRDFVNSPASQVSAENTSVSNMIGKVVLLCLATMGVIYTFALMCMAHG